MPKAHAYPFVRPTLDPLEGSGEWMLILRGEEPRPLGDHVEEWDYQVDLFLCRHYRLDPTTLREDCQLDPGTPILLKISVHSPVAQPKRRRASAILEERLLNEDEPVDIDLDLTVAGSNVFTSFELVTELILAEDNSSPRMGIASRAGSRLFQEGKRVRVEGAKGRFPVQEVDLSESRTPGCAWKLVWNVGDWDEDYYQGMILHLNTGNPRVREAIQSRDPVFTAMMRFDIARQLIMAALRSEDFVSRGEDFEEDSLGHFVRSLMSRCFPQGELPALVHELKSSPGLFEAKLQSALDIMGGF